MDIFAINDIKILIFSAAIHIDISTLFGVEISLTLIM